jgi:hypothetical protein
MHRILWLIGGVIVGAFAAHLYSKTDSGSQFFTEFDSKTKEFRDAVSEGYKARESELRAAVANVEDAITEFSKKI